MIFVIMGVYRGGISEINTLLDPQEIVSWPRHWRLERNENSIKALWCNTNVSGSNFVSGITPQ